MKCGCCRTAKTPSDYRAEDRQLSDLKHALGVVKVVATNGARRAKKTTTAKAEPKTRYAQPVNSEFANKLRAAGVSESVLRDENAMLREEIEILHDRDEIMRQRVFAAEDWIKQCWLCRFRKWWRRET